MFKRHQQQLIDKLQAETRIIHGLAEHNVTINPDIESRYDQQPSQGFTITFVPRYVNSQGLYDDRLGLRIADQLPYRLYLPGWSYRNGKFTRFTTTIPDWSIVLKEITHLQRYITKLMDQAFEWKEIATAVNRASTDHCRD